MQSPFSEPEAILQGRSWIQCKLIWFFFFSFPNKNLEFGLIREAWLKSQ